MIKNKKNIIVLLVIILALFLGYLASNFYFQTQEEKEIQAIKLLAKNHPDGQIFVEEILSAREELKDKDRDNDLQAYLRIGINLNLLGEPQKALENYQKALKINSKNFLALNNIANIYSDLGKYEKAEEHFLRILDYYPDQVGVYRNLGYLYRYRLNKKPTEIETFFKKGLEETNNHPDLLNWLTNYFLEIGDNYKFVEYANLLEGHSIQD